MITKWEGKDKKNRDRRSEPQSLREQQEYWKDGRTRGQRSELQSLSATEYGRQRAEARALEPWSPLVAFCDAVGR
jgi:hypothetical protein